MEKSLELIKDLIEEMADLNWQITEVVPFELVKEDDDTFAKIEGDDTLYKEQDNHYIKQHTSFEDFYSGVIIKPITDKVALKIDYAC